MNQRQIAKQVAKNLGINLKDSFKLFKETVNVITKVLSEGKDVRIVGFGHFIVRNYKPRTAWNFETQQAVAIPARRYPAFMPGKNLKASVQKEQV